MKELVKVIAVSLVDHPDEIVVTEKETENSIILELHVAPDDMGKVIRASRDVLLRQSALLSRQQLPVMIKK